MQGQVTKWGLYVPHFNIDCPEHYQRYPFGTKAVILARRSVGQKGSKQSFAAAIPKVYYADKAGIYVGRLVPDQLA